jgi:NADPH:quinone reductase
MTRVGSPASSSPLICRTRSTSRSAGGATFQASLAAARRVTGRIVVYGMAGGEAAITSSELIFKHQVHLIGLHIGVLARTAPQIFAELMAELAALIAAGVVPPGRPTVYDLADGPKALADLEARATVGKLALRPWPVRSNR